MPDLLLLVALVGASLAGAGWVAHKLGLPPALGYLGAGMAFAPSVSSTPDLPIAVMDVAAEIGVLIVLFFIGLELDLRTLRRIMSSTVAASALNILLPAAAVLAIGQLLGWDFRQALVLGLAVSLSSTLFGERLSALPSFPRAGRQRNFGILIGEDVAAGVILGLMAVLGGAGNESGWSIALPVGELFFFLILAAAAALLVVPRVLDAVSRTHVQELLLITSLVVVVLFGLVGQFLGSRELGAFLAGMAAAEAGSRFVLRNVLSALRDLGLAFFFLAAGLHVQLDGLAQHVLPVLAIAGAFLATKLLVHLPSAMASGLNLQDGIRTALGLGTIGEFSLILAAAAASHGLAHPLLGTYIVGVMLVLLVATPLLLNVVPRVGPALERIPRRIVRPMAWFVQGITRSNPTSPRSESRRRQIARTLAANVILLVAWLLLVSAGGPLVAARIPASALVSGALVFGLAVAVAAPLVYWAYRAYRDLVRMLVGIESGESAGRVRARLVDAWVAATVIVLLLPVALALPTAWPVLLGGFLLAVAIVGLAWRNLSRFHRALEGSITRVLGQEPRAEALMDEVMRKYPWGVRFAAVNVPADSPVAGLSLAESRLTELTGAMVAVLHSQGAEKVNPPLDARLSAGDTLILLGQEEELDTAEALVVAHGQALRQSVRSRLAEIVEIPIGTGSPMVGQTLGALDLKGRTGALVVGLWPHGASHPEPFRPDLSVRAEDHLILLGSELQVERARQLAEGV